jgi:hypothetical protein
VKPKRSSLEVQLKSHGRLYSRVEGPNGLFRAVSLFYQPVRDDWRLNINDYDNTVCSFELDDFEHIHAVFSRLAEQTYEDWAAGILAGETLAEMLDLV